MNTITHPVAAEEIMALLDGELTTSEAKAVTAHLEICKQCTAVADQFRSTSEWLARWHVPPTPVQVEASIQAKMETLDVHARQHSAVWNWRPWTFGAGGTLAAALLLLVMISSTSHHRAAFLRASIRPQSEMMLEESRLAPQTGHSGIAPAAAKVPAPVSKSELRASDTNGLIHGMGDHASNSFSVDGQPMGGGGGAPTRRASTQALSEAASETPMIARTISITVMVKDFAAARTLLDTIVARHHGYSAQLNSRTPEGGPSSLDASLRIPAPELTSALAELKTLGRVENEIQSGEEVTQQHADLVARLHNARETEDRLRAILQQRTGKISDILEVEEEIARVRGEIETMEAEQQTLEHRVDFASVDLQLTEEYKARLDTPADSVGTRLRNAFVAGYHNAVETVLGIVLFFEEYGPELLIWLIILGTPIFFVWRRYRKSRTS
jgi:anti-sigma factor RsiW